MDFTKFFFNLLRLKEVNQGLKQNNAIQMKTIG
jgi:hypothetical protein